MPSSPVGGWDGAATAVTAGDESLTSTGMVMGTVEYMSPEQVRAEELDARTDLFSFGVMLYEMATGRRAFAGDSVGVIFDGILNRAPISPLQQGAVSASALPEVPWRDRDGPRTRPLRGLYRCWDD